MSIKVNPFPQVSIRARASIGFRVNGDNIMADNDGLCVSVVSELKVFRLAMLICPIKGFIRECLLCIMDKKVGSVMLLVQYIYTNVKLTPDHWLAIL